MPGTGPSALLLLLSCLPSPGLSFHFADPNEQIVHAFDDALPKQLLPELTRECTAAHDWER
jgi:hypothetical protein